MAVLSPERPQAKWGPEACRLHQERPQSCVSTNELRQPALDLAGRVACALFPGPQRAKRDAKALRDGLLGPPLARPQDEKGLHEGKLEGEGFSRLDVRHRFLGLNVSEVLPPTRWADFPMLASRIGGQPASLNRAR